VERFDPSLDELKAAHLSLEGHQAHASKLTLLDSPQLMDGPRPLFVDCRHD
jgi:hypothetical protein